MTDTPHSAELVPTRSDALTTADLEVSPATVELARNGIADNTRRAYTRWWERFTVWCAAHGRTALPATHQTFAEFVGQLAREDQAPASIKQAMSAIRTVHRKAGYPKGTPNNEGALDVLRGHQKRRAADGKGRQKKAPPIVSDALLALLAACDPATLAGQCDRLMLILGIALMGRRSELAALTFNDVTVTEEGLLIYIRESKTDQDAVGEDVAVPRSANEVTDPVRAFAAWRASLQCHGVTDGPLLRRIKDERIIGSMNGAAVNAAIRRLARAAELDNAETYTAHSLRAGGATMAYKAGAWKDNPMRGVL